MLAAVVALLTALCLLNGAAPPVVQARYVSTAASDSPRGNSSTASYPEFVIRHSQGDNLDDSLFDLHPKYCKKTAKCQPLNYTMCMGAKLPYSSTTLELTDLISQEKVQEKLHIFQYLRYIPKCWAVIQPFLCALYMPKCEDDFVHLPSREMCRITLGPCKIFYNSSIFPKFLDCDDDRVFPSKCKNDVHELKFNTSGFCMEPLVKTDQPDWFYPDVEGCGLRCKDSLYTETEHYQIHKGTAYGVPICIFVELFIVATFIIDWNTANKYPTLAIFYMNICFLISYSGWAIQFLGSESREDVVCKKDGTLRRSEPSASENLSCVIVFVMVYYSFIAGIVWFVIFSYAWHMSSLQALGKTQERVDKKRAYFHLVAWSLPLILTITTMALGQIDGDYVTGICFVSFAARPGLLLAPLGATIIVAGYFIIPTLILLNKVKHDGKEIISEHSNRKISSNILRMGGFGLLIVVCCIITFIYHVYIWMNSGAWDASLRSYILCKLTSFSSDYSHCKQEARPSVAMLQLQQLAVFGAGIFMALIWVLCPATFHSWARYIRKKFGCEMENPMKIQKHKMIAQAYAQREQFNQGKQISIDCQNYSDPVGLQFDLNSAASNGLSTTWANNLPKLMNRRGAMVSEMAYSTSNHDHSIDSEVSLSVKHVSIESRCNSGDSQLSMQIAELKARKRVRSRRHRGGRPNQSSRHHHHNLRRGSRDRLRRHSRSEHGGARHASSGSLDSHLHLLNMLTNTCEIKSARPNMNRRTGNAGLDGNHINKLLSNGKLVIPYNVNNAADSEVEEENVSVTISESKYKVISTNNANLDLNDQLVVQSLRKGLHIQELNSSTDSEEEQEPCRYSKNGGRDSKGSRRSRDSKLSKTNKKLNKLSIEDGTRTKRYSSHSDDLSAEDEENRQSDSSSCPEIQRLLQNCET